MNTTHAAAVSTARDGSVFPRDIVDCIGAPDLARWISEEVEAVLPMIPIRRRSFCRGMFNLLVYSYCRGITHSEEIAHLLKSERQDIEFRESLGFPATAIIREFRRRHRATVEQVLAKVLTRVRARDLHGEMGPATEESLEEAKRRVDEGVFLDAIYLDW